MRLELSHGTTIAAVIGQAVVDLKLEVKGELVLTHYNCHGRGSITRSDDLERSERFTTMLSASKYTFSKISL